MQNPPIANIGVKGVRKAAAEVARWDSLLEPGELRVALFNVWIFVSATGGTGGGAFRRMFSRFLAEAADIARRPEQTAAGAGFRSIIDACDEIAIMACTASEERGAVRMASHLPAISAALLDIAEREEAGWKELARIVH